jgi:hypothetical protein
MAIKIPTKIKSVAEVKADLEAAAQKAVISQYPNIVVIRVESRSGNLLDGKNAAGQGLVYGRLVKVIKGSTVMFESSDGEVNEVEIKQLIDGQFAMNLGVAESRHFINKFHQLKPEQSGSRRCEVQFAFGDEIFVNSNATIITEGVTISDLTAPQGQAIASKDDFLNMFKKKTQDSRDYRKNMRDQYRAEAMQQLEAMNNPEPSAESPELTQELASLDNI